MGAGSQGFGSSSTAFPGHKLNGSWIDSEAAGIRIGGPYGILAKILSFLLSNSLLAQGLYGGIIFPKRLLYHLLVTHVLVSQWHAFFMELYLVVVIVTEAVLAHSSC